MENSTNIPPSYCDDLDDWKAPTSDDDRNRLAVVYMGKDLSSDMSFLLESDGTRIPAHTLIVSAASEVLQQMIDRCTDGEIVVQVPHCSREEFMLILRYLYVPGI